MSVQRILLITTIKEEICKNLTFEDAINFRDALNLSSLKCQIPINDKDQQVLFLGGVNDATIITYQLIQSLGSSKALAFVSGMGGYEKVKILLDNGADVNKMDWVRDTALIRASLAGHANITQLLLERGADVNIMNQYGNTALILASNNGRLEAVKVLLKYKAVVDATDSRGNTPLMLASQRGYLEIIQVLVENRANFNVVNQDGKTALKLAIRNNYPETVEFLKSIKTH